MKQKKIGLAFWEIDDDVKKMYAFGGYLKITRVHQITTNDDLNHSPQTSEYVPLLNTLQAT